jgi:hypothetical protein
VEARIIGAGKEIGIERDDYVSLIERVLKIDAFGEGGTGESRLVLNQPGLGIRLLDCFPLPRQRGRCDCRAQEIDSGAIF